MAIDDVSDLSRRVRYTSGAGQTAFTYPFRIFEEADLKVYVDDILQTLGVAYNVTGVDNDTGGSVVFLAGLSAGQIVTIYSDTELNRDTDYQQNGPWGSARLNSEFDKLMVIAQELRAKLARAIRGSVLGNTVAEMPSAADRASKYLYFNASGDPTVVTGDPSQPITHRVYVRYPLTGDTVIPVPADYTPGSYDLSVYLNGLKLVRDDDYAETSTNSITLVVPATTGDVIEFDIGTVFDVTLAKSARVSQFITGITGTTLTLTTISYTPGGNEIDVFMNGSRLAPADYTETNSTTITLASAANSSDEFMVIVGRVTDVLTADRSQIGAALYPITAAEIAASVTPTDYSYPPGDIRRYGAAVGADSTSAINKALSVSQSISAPEGDFLTSGGHLVNGKQDIICKGLGRTRFIHTSSTGCCFNLPSYTGSESAVQFGGQTFRGFSVVGTGATNNTQAFKLKQQTDTLFDHVEITGFGVGVQGARDNTANSCTGITFIAPRILSCGVGILAGRQWNGLRTYGGVIGGDTWSIVAYDTQDIELRSIFQGGAYAVGAIFLGGCSAFKIGGYCEGSASSGAFVSVASSKDVSGSATNNGIAIGMSYGGEIAGTTFSSGPGVAYGVLVDGAHKVSFIGNMAGSGITTALARLVTGTTKCSALSNHVNPGAVFSYQTASDANSNFELDDNGRIYVAHTQKLNIAGGGAPAAGLSGGIVGVCGADTGHLFMDNARNNDDAGLYLNFYGYLGAYTKFRDTLIGDGKGNTLVQVDASADKTTFNTKLNLADIPTSASGLAAGDVWNSAGTLKIV